MKPAPFSYVKVRSLDEALARLDGDDEAKILAGGQSLVPMLNMRLVRPTTLVDINRVPGLDVIRVTADGGLTLGALVRHTDLVASPLVRSRAPLLAAAATYVGHRAIRNRGTLGGSLAHADPAAELSAAVLALDATLVVAGPRGLRRLPAAQFFRGPLTTALESGDILTDIEIPGPARAAWGFAEVARRAGDFAIAGVAGVVSTAPDERARGRAARLVAFGAADTPLRLAEAEALFDGARVDAALARAVGEAAGRGVHPHDDLHASAEYRRHLVAVLAERVAREAFARRGA